METKANYGLLSMKVETCNLSSQEQNQLGIIISKFAGNNLCTTICGSTHVPYTFSISESNYIELDKALKKLPTNKIKLTKMN